MRLKVPLVCVLSIAWASTWIHGQITSNPIPAPIEKRGLAVEIKDLVRLPDTRSLRFPTPVRRPRATSPLPSTTTIAR